MTHWSGPIANLRGRIERLEALSLEQFKRWVQSLTDDELEALVQSGPVWVQSLTDEQLETLAATPYLSQEQLERLDAGEDPATVVGSPGRARVFLTRAQATEANGPEAA